MNSHAIVAVALVASAVGVRPALAAGPETAAPAGVDRPAAAESQEPQRRRLQEAELSAYNGGQDAGVQVQATQTLTATNSGNTIGGDLNSGDVSFSEAAMDGFNGVGNVVINTGANSNLQGNILVTVIGAPDL
ncbi:MAG: hypothetical protein WCY15_14555 [Phenylobacterium sp.]|jgi:hypothetical protein|uniref:hypothetical protein n=1 Tax=Phenylobacterium sp. TaxID=1871053 RepID=UPI002A29A0DB|nr:hypothetical protein [Phenylobacterium sp.]MDD3838113.1 hypothetical protein [Phenylobacterium sp.]MDX9996918.1 hypothetical protein [Phenylobacterium sp.]